MSEKPDAGWMAEKAAGTQVYHYIEGALSLCGRLGFYRGELQSDRGLPAPGRHDCRRCFRMLRKREPTPEAQEGKETT